MPQTFGCLNESLAGYWGYTPVYNCVQGYLTDCVAGGYPLNGTPVTVCGVATVDTGKGEADAGLRVMYVDGLEDEAAPAPASAGATGTATSNAAGRRLGRLRPLGLFWVVSFTGLLTRFLV